MPPFETSLRGSVQPNQTLGTKSSAKSRPLSSCLGEACRDSIGTWSHFRPHQMRRNQTTEIEHHSLSLIGLATAHNVSELKAASIAMAEALDLEQEVLSLHCHQKQQSQTKNAASILVQTAATSATDGAPPTCRRSRELVRHKHSAVSPPFSCAEGTRPLSGLSMKRKRKPHPGG